MPKEWIIDVLADLQAFAERNGLEATAAGVEDAVLVAMAELAAQDTTEPILEPAPAHVETGRHADNVTELFPRRNLA